MKKILLFLFLTASFVTGARVATDGEADIADVNTVISIILS